MNVRYGIRFTLIMITAGGLGLAAQQAATQRNAPAAPLPPTPQMTVRPVTDQDLLAGLKDQTRWLTFSGDYNGQRHSPLTQLTPQNVSGLVPGWIFQTASSTLSSGALSVPRWIMLSERTPCDLSRRGS